MNSNYLTYAIPQWLIASKVYMVVITDLEGNYLYVNELFKTRFSFFNQDFIESSINKTVHEEDQQKCTNAGIKAIQNPNESVEVRLRKPKNNKGDYVWSDWEFSAYKNQQGEIIGVLSVGHDVSKLERLQRKAKVLREKTDAIIENITDGFFVLDTKWRFVKINRIAEKVLNVPPKFVLRKVIWDLFTDVENYKYPQEFKNAVKNKVPTSFQEYQPITDKWYQVLAYPSDRGLTVFFKDITNEKKSQEKLKNSENKLKAILESTTNGIMLISPDLKILSFNQVANNITFATFQKNLEEGKDFRNFLFENTQEDFFYHFNKALKGEIVTIERLYSVGTKNIWYDIHYYPVYAFDTKEIIGVALNSVDVSIKKQAEEALKNSENKLRAISESTINSNILLSTTHKILTFNKVANEIALRLWHTPLQENEDFYKFLPKGAEDDFNFYFNKALKGESSTIERQRIITNIPHWFEVHYFPVYDDNSQIMGIALNTIDINTRKKAQEALAQSQYMLHALYNSTQDACVFLDNDFKMVYFNKMAEKTAILLFNHPCKIGDNVIDFLYPAFVQEFVGYFERAKKGEYIQIEKYLNTLWWEFSLLPVYDTKNILVGVALNVKDITTRKSYEEQIIAQNDILKDVAWQQSHAIRRPLSSILGLIKLISEDKAYNQIYFEYLATSAQELDNAIRRIVAYAERLEE